MQERIRKAEEGTEIRELTVTALLTALTYLFTAFVNVRLPIAANGGLIHLGNVPLFLGAMLFGRRVGNDSGCCGNGTFRSSFRMGGLGAFYGGDRGHHGLRGGSYDGKTQRFCRENGGSACSLPD